MNNQEFSVDEIQQYIKRHYKTIVSVIVVLVVGFGSFFQIGTEEEGVVTRFGKHVRTVAPGLKMKIPFVEKVYKVPVERQKTGIWFSNRGGQYQHPIQSDRYRYRR